MKGPISLISGLIIGLIVSYFVLDRNGWTIKHIGAKGELTKTINGLDFDLITNGFLIIAGMSIFIYLMWTLIERYSNDYK